MTKVKRIGTFILLIAGAIMCIIMAVNNVKNQGTFTHTEGTITSITWEYVGDDTRYTVMVSYTADGVDYESELNEYNAAMKEGKIIKICYDPNDPMTIQKVGVMNVLMPILVALMCIAGAFAVMFRRR